MATDNTTAQDPVSPSVFRSILAVNAAGMTSKQKYEHVLAATIAYVSEHSPEENDRFIGLLENWCQH